MEIAAKHPAQIENISSGKAISLVKKFTDFANSMEEYRILLLSAMILIQGCIIVPVTILVISIFDIGIGGFSVGLLAVNTLGILVANMAELPIKAILIMFLLSVLSSVTILGIHLL